MNMTNLRYHMHIMLKTWVLRKFALIFENYTNKQNQLLTLIRRQICVWKASKNICMCTLKFRGRTPHPATMQAPWCDFKIMFKNVIYLLYIFMWSLKPARVRSCIYSMHIVNNSFQISAGRMTREEAGGSREQGGNRKQEEGAGRQHHHITPLSCMYVCMYVYEISNSSKNRPNSDYKIEDEEHMSMDIVHVHSRIYRMSVRARANG
jgi:hypothetical protein